MRMSWPGGKVSFVVTPDENGEEQGKYRLSLGGTPGTGADNTISWTLTLEDLQEKKSMEPLTLDVSLKDGSAVFVDRGGGETAEKVNGVSVKIVYTDGREETLRSIRAGGSDTFSYYRETSGFNPAQPDDGTSGIILTVTTDINNHVEVGATSRYYLTDKLSVKLGANPYYAGADEKNQEQDIARYEITFTSQIYNNIDGEGKPYRAVVSAERDGNPISDLKAEYATGKGFGSLYAPGLSTNAKNPSGSYEYFPAEVDTSLSAQSGFYYGNAYWLEYTPADSGTTSGNDGVRGNYYVNMGAFAEGGSINGTTTFRSLRIAGCTDWHITGTLTVSEIRGGYFAGKGQSPAVDGADLVVQHQMKEAFSDSSYSGSDVVVVYRSIGKVDGRYIYILVDPKTRGNAVWNRSNGWTELIRQDSLAPASWKLYVFNAPAANLTADFTQSLGALHADGTTGGWSTQDKLEVGYVTGSHSPLYTKSGYGATHYPATHMKGIWVDDETVFWMLTFDAQNIPSWYTTYVYVQPEYGQTVLTGESGAGTASVNGETLEKRLIYVKNGNRDTWDTLNGDKTLYSNGGGDILENNLIPTLEGNNIWMMGRGSGTNGNLSGYRDSNGDITIGFFTKVAGGSVSGSAKEISCKAEAVLVGHDISKWGNTGAQQYNIKLSASGMAPIPQLSKSARTVSKEEDEDDGKLRTEWSVEGILAGSRTETVNSPLLSGKYRGYFSGNLTLHDDMAGSAAKDDAGNPVESSSPAQYTVLESVTLSGSGPGGSFGTGMNAEMLEKAAASSDHSYTTQVMPGSGKTVTMTVIYKGNMKDGFDLKLEGVDDAYKLSVTYVTALDQAAFCKSVAALEQNPAAWYDVTLENGLTTDLWSKQSRPPVTQTVETQVVAALALNKYADAMVRDELTGGLTGSYRLETKVGYSSTDYVEIEDFISGFGNRSEDGNASGKSYTEDDREAIAALCDSLLLDPAGFVISVKAPGQSAAQVIYENRSFAEGWAKNSSLLPKKGTHPGTLFTARLEKDSGQLRAGTEFLISYKMTLNMDDSSNGRTPFRPSPYYTGEAVEIANSAEASRSYEMETLSRSRRRASRTGGTIDKENMKLTVDCGGSVDSTYLADEVIDKELLLDMDLNGHSQWLVYDWSGTEGKEKPTVRIKDAFHFILDNVFEDRTDLTAQQKEEKRSQLQALLEKYASYSNVKVYETKKKPGKNGEALTQDNLIWQADGKIDGTLQGQGGGHDLTLTYTPYGEGGPLLEIGADDMDFNRYLVMVYDLDVDIRAFSREALRLGLLDENWHAAGTDRDLSWTMKNEASNSKGETAEEVGSEVELRKSDLTKQLVDSDAQEGTASWSISAYTGTEDGEDLILTDEVKISASDERIRAAAAAAVSVDAAGIRLEVDGKAVYEKGGLTETAKAAGWTAGNLTLWTQGAKLKVTVRNTDSCRALDKGQTWTVFYDTAFDKDAFLQNGGRAGDEYTLANSAGLELGSSSLRTEKSTDFRPDIPLEAKKSCDGYDGQRQNVLVWTATANTGEAARRQLVLEDGVKASTQTAQDALMLERMTIRIKGPDGEQEYTPDRLPEGAGITGPDGGTLQMNTAGVSGFVLTFEELAAHTEVTVEYAVKLDREQYLANGGQVGDEAELENSFRVSDSHGYEAEASGKGSATVTKTFEKTGVKQKDPSADGYPVLSWQLDADLNGIFEPEELEKLKEVTIRDPLNPVLVPLMETVRIYPVTLTADGPQVSDTPLGADQYTAVYDGSSLTVTLTDPKECGRLRLVFETECRASLDGLTNTAELIVDGTKVEDSTSEDVGKIEVDDQYGLIQAFMVPEYTPVAWKYLDSILCTDRTFDFAIEQVDENGSPVAGGYTDTAQNDGTGKITFRKIVYRQKPVEGTYYYRIWETSRPDPDSFVKDERVFTVKVTVQKGTGGYLVTDTVTAPANYDQVRFDNTTVTTRDFTVTKQWEDGNDKYGCRPRSITVYLLNNGQRYNDMSVILSEANHWTYTWKDLPIADGNYSVEEAEVAYYDGTVVTQGWNSRITNTLREEGALEITKTVTGSGDKNRSFTFTLWLTDLGGSPLAGSYPYTGSKSGSIGNGDTVTLKHGERIRIEGLPAGTAYTVREQEANQEGYVTGASGSSGTIFVGRTQEAAFENGKPQENTPVEETVSLTADKRWEDDESADRPLFAGVQLYRNGEAWGSPVQLSQQNGWSYTWSGLETGVLWTVDEPEVPEGYLKSISFEGGRWTITNTLDREGIYTESGRTGDNASPWLWTGLLLAAAAGIGAILLKAKKKRDGKDSFTAENPQK
ncbi:MAG: Cna B-type domain-containing protein [Eubacteriales bacterium]|nr:Cna B-type domain-containing protein [Eubacteriales bacterium]